jgi:putative acetyltransferase
VIVRGERHGDVEAIAEVVREAFIDQAPAGTEPVEVALVEALRADAAWIPSLSLVAEVAGQVVGHVLATRGHVDGHPALGLAPLAVRPAHQGRGIGSALVEALLAQADADGEALVALLGDPAYYSRFGFVRAEELGVVPPVPEWAPHFQARPLDAYDPQMRGTFTYAAPFAQL